MRALTNDYKDCKLIKLSGPPVIRDLPVLQADVRNYLARVGSGSSPQELQRQFLARYRAAKGDSDT